MIEQAGTRVVCSFEEAERLLGARERMWSAGGDGLCVSFAAAAAQELQAEQARDGLARARGLRRVARLVLGTGGEPDGLCLGEEGCGCAPAGGEALRGRFLERTHFEFCTACGDCVPVCGFGARWMACGDLEIARERCHGCGLCVEVCPELCVKLVARL